MWCSLLRYDSSSLSHIHQWSRAGERAPHKPLLVLFAIASTLNDESRLLAFNDVEGRLRDLIETFGPARQRVHPEYPFWRLQSDGFWEVVDASSFATRRSNTDPPIRELRRRDARAGFVVDLDQQLRADKDAARDCAASLALRFFPRQETAVLDAVELRR
jgi:putative restriction endonuclease